MRRSGFWAKVFGAAAALTLTVSGVAAEDLTPNGQRAKDAFEKATGGPSVDPSRVFNTGSGELYADVMAGSMSIQREFRRALPSIYSYTQTAHYQDRADVGSDAAYASAADYTYAVCPTTMCAPGKKWVMWDVPFLMRETKKREDGYLGYNNRASGFATGISRLIGDHSAIGLAVGYDQRKLDGRDGYHMRNRADTLHLALYGGTNIGYFFLDGYAGWSRAWNRSENNIDTTPGNTVSTMKANYNDDVYSAGLKASYVWILGNDARITPSIGVDFSHVRLDSFSIRNHTTGNRNAGGVRSSSYSNLAMPIMVSANKTFSSNFLKFRGACSLWTPEVRGGWVPQFGSDRATAKMYDNINGGRWNAKSSKIASSYGTVGAGLKIKLADKYIFGVDYDYTVAKKYSNHSFTAMYGVSF